MKDHEASTSAEATKSDEAATAGTRFLDVITPVSSEPDYSNAIYLLPEFIEHLAKYIAK